VQKTLVRLSDGTHHALDPETRKLVYKTFMIVASCHRRNPSDDGNPFLCNKHCPFCTAQATLWPRVDDQWEKMPDRLAECERANLFFEYLTMSGNGEPSMVRPRNLVYLREVFDRYNHLFRYRRFQTGGYIFTIDRVFSAFHDFVFEITRLSADDDKDMVGLGYRPNYTRTENFKSSKVVFNIVLLQNNVHEVLDIIRRYIDRFGDILYALNLKILNPNTFDPTALANPFSQWIIKNGLPKDRGQEVVDIMDGVFTRAMDLDPFFDRYEWEGPKMSDGRRLPITLYARKARYGLANVVYYGGGLVDYQLHDLVLPTAEEYQSVIRAAQQTGLGQ